MTLPLDGVRVLDLSRLLPGPFCSLLLADFGADVIKVEDTGAGDYLRWAPPRYEDAAAAAVEPSAAGAPFAALNRGKRSIRLDLKSDGGRDAFLALVASADVVLESFRPGVMERLGVGYARLSQLRPELVYCAITGYGQDGPLRDRPGHDIDYLALGGMLGLTGDAGGPPVQGAGQIADIGGGALMAAVGILLALRERDRSGAGQLVDCSMFDGALSWLAMPAAETFASGRAPARGELGLGGRYVCYRPYACADGWVALGALEPKFWAAFCEGVGRPDLLGAAYEAPGSDAHAAVCAVIAQRTREQWTAFAAEHDCCLEPVLGLEEALDSELVAARRMVVALAGGGGARGLGVPIKLGRTPGDPERGPAPRLGEHTDEVLGQAGLSADEIAALHAGGAVAGPPAGGGDGDGGDGSAFRIG